MLGLLPRYRDFRRLMARQFGDPGRIVVAVSKMCARDYQHYHGVPPERIRLVYHGSDNRRFSPEHRGRWREAVRRRLGVGGRRGAAVVRGPRLRAEGAGARPSARSRGWPRKAAACGWRWWAGSAAAARCDCGGASAAVTLVGTVDDPVPYYAAADAFVLPTFYDPCSLSVSEAAASGLPSVTTRLNGAAELLDRGGGRIRAGRPGRRRRPGRAAAQAAGPGPAAAAWARRRDNWPCATASTATATRRWPSTARSPGRSAAPAQPRWAAHAKLRRRARHESPGRQPRGIERPAALEPQRGALR